MTETTQRREGQRRVLVGEVVSDRMQKTIVVEVRRRVRHPRYEKVINKFKKFYAHDEKQQARMGDVVRIEESRPLSRLKRWRLVEIVQRATAVEKVET
ncbi:MAG: 30S ribosomal protein S17 [Verrucomicrobiae bacterium]|nr:30S ribosomal protein S17 [Verrucomicrobiae bacterium]MCX7915532.1 30S ribosomal protein S17 [Verrucomicrobiae bacterium]MDW8344563.1 30S ribosomal protein S17 [Verrucomicrobiae bacterium]